MIAIVVVVIVAAMEALRREERQVGIVECEHEKLVRVVAVADRGASVARKSLSLPMKSVCLVTGLSVTGSRYVTS